MDLETLHGCALSKNLHLITSKDIVFPQFLTQAHKSKCMSKSVEIVDFKLLIGI